MSWWKEPVFLKDCCKQAKHPSEWNIVHAKWLGEYIYKRRKASPCLDFKFIYWSTEEFNADGKKISSLNNLKGKAKFKIYTAVRSFLKKPFESLQNSWSLLRSLNHSSKQDVHKIQGKKMHFRVFLPFCGRDRSIISKWTVNPIHFIS